jgi:hypothetical protein
MPRGLNRFIADWHLSLFSVKYKVELKKVVVESADQ